jgi:hypothetical protein
MGSRGGNSFMECQLEIVRPMRYEGEYEPAGQMRQGDSGQC